MRRLILALPFIILAPAAFAQDAGDASMINRLNRLERDLNFLQRQVYRGATADGSTPVTGDVGSAQAQVTISQLQEQIRQLRGEIEQVQYQNKQVGDAQKKFETDIDFRLQALEQKQAAAETAAATAAAAPAAAPEKVPAAKETAKETAKEKAAEKAAEKTAEKATATETVKDAKEPATYSPKDKEAAATEEKPSATGKDFPNANEAYNHAFKQFSDKNYSAAVTSFDDFVRQYPDDPLAANAYYWLGECYYARGDFTRSSDAFRKGFEKNPDGQKAPDNLYKLGMSLASVKRVNEACIVLGQVIDKYGDANPRTREKAAAERTNLQCK